MRKEDIVVGNHVRISEDIIRTANKFFACDGMYDLRGKVRPVESFQSNNGILVASYTWVPEDLEFVEVEINPQPFHFNVEELMT